MTERLRSWFEIKPIEDLTYFVKSDFSISWISWKKEMIRSVSYWDQIFIMCVSEKYVYLAISHYYIDWDYTKVKQSNMHIALEDFAKLDVIEWREIPMRASREFNKNINEIM